MPGAVKGKLGYMAPEQARGEEIDRRVDVFGLGAVLYEMLTGHNPFLESGSTTLETLERMRTGQFRPPSHYTPLPQAVESIVLRAMASDREQRYATCAAMREDLEGFARRESYSLSPQPFGAFVRSLLEVPEPTEAGPESWPTAPMPKMQRAPVTSPKFDAALGVELAALSGTRVEQKERTVALHPVIAPPEPSETERAPSAAPEAVRPDGPTVLTDIIRPRGPRIIAALLIVALVAFIVVAIFWVQRNPLRPPATGAHAAIAGSATTAAPPAVAPPPESPAEPKAPKEPPKSPTVAAAPHTRSHYAKDTTMRSPKPIDVVPLAHITVESDAPATLFIDNVAAGDLPLEGLGVNPGEHKLRVEGAHTGLRLVPRELTVRLAPGESRHFQVDLQ
jgi:serine/threonine-protein kinase